MSSYTAMSNGQVGQGSCGVQKWRRIFGAMMIAAVGSYLILALSRQSPTLTVRTGSHTVTTAELQRGKITPISTADPLLEIGGELSDGQVTKGTGVDYLKPGSISEQRMPEAYNKLSVDSNGFKSVTDDKGVTKTDAQPTGNNDVSKPNQNFTVSNSQSHPNTSNLPSLASNKTQVTESEKVVPKQPTKPPAPPPNSPIYKYTNIESRFNEAEKRIKTISKDALAKVGYPGVSIHRRKWHYPITIPDCTAEVENFLILVPSSPKNFEDRKIVRSTWGNSVELKKLKSKLVFVVGLTKDAVIQEHIAEESVQLGDIVQLDMYDAYYNLTIKTLGMLTWASEHCKTPKYVAKIDDDNLVNLHSILNILDNYRNKYERFIAGSYRNGGVPARGGKWADPVYKPLYKAGDRYPVFLGGPAYFLTNNFVDRLVNKCAELPLIHLEDVFVTGICGDQLKDVKKLSVGGMHMSRIDACQFLKPGVNLAHDYPVNAIKPAWDKWHSSLCKTVVRL